MLRLRTPTILLLLILAGLLQQQIFINTALAIVGRPSPDRGEAVPIDSAEAASQGLEFLRNIYGGGPDDPSSGVKLGDSQAKRLGFKSSEEVVQARLGIPYLVFRIQVERLKGFQVGDDPESLLIDEHRMIYPLLVQNQVRSSLTVTHLKKEGKWRATRRGSPD